MSSFTEAMAAADQAKEAGDVQAAWRTLQSVLDFPKGVELDDADFGEALMSFYAIAHGNMADEAVVALGAAGFMPANADLLYKLGYQMIEVGLFRFAATALARANVIVPENPGILNELSSALESAGFNYFAFQALHDAPQARAQNWFSRYLYVFNAIMCGRMDEARTGFAALGPAEDTNSEFMQAKVATLLGRYDALAGHSLLHEQDLRGWHYVIAGGILTHISPHGFDEGMSGRYAMVQDSNELIHEGIIRAASVLHAWGQSPTQLIYSPDRSSEVLAHAWNKRTGVAIKRFDADDGARPGLFLAYDLLDADPHFSMALEQRDPDQILVSHASCWTQEFPFTSDISTFLYQHNVVPWGEGRMQVDPATQQVERLAADETTPAEALADAIASSTLESDAIQDAEVLTALAAAVGSPSPGRRDRFYVGSPVQSARFI